MDRIAVMIPCFNEEQTIQKVITDFRKELPEAIIYVYDNASTDQTAVLADEAGAIVRSELKKGKGNVIRRMFREIDADCYILVDGDDTYAADNARTMADMVLDQQIDMVIGDRLSSSYFTENKRRFHNFGNRLVRFAINYLFDCNIEDIMTGYRAFSYQFVKSFPVLSRGFEIETEMTIHALDKNMAIRAETIGYKDRPDGSESKLNTITDGVAVIRTILRLWKNYRPFHFFGFWSGLFFVIDSIIFILRVLSPYLETGRVAHFPTLIVCGFVAIGCLIGIFSGMILDVMASKSRQDFEFRLQLLQFRRDLYD